MRLRRVPVELGAPLLRVLGDVDEHRSGTTRLRDRARLTHRRRDIVGAGDEVVVLGDRQRDAGDVGLLKRVLPQNSARDLSGDRNERGAVHPRVGDRGHQIGRARSTGRDTDARFSGRARVAFRCVSRALFVTTQYVTQAIPILPHRVIERHYRAAGDAEHDFDILAHECFAHHLCARARRGMGDAGRGGGVGHALTPPTVGR